MLADLARDRYDECRLLLCRSAGSSVERRVRDAVELKARATVEFMERVAGGPVNGDAFCLMVMSQLHTIEEVLDRGCGADRAADCIRTITHYTNAAWERAFEEFSGR